MEDLKQSIKEKARQLGFSLAGVTSAAPPPHYETFAAWLGMGHHGTMQYLSNERSRTRRADPVQVLPECKSILILGFPYDPPLPAENNSAGHGKIAAYALGDDYHDLLPVKLKEIVSFIEKTLGHTIPNRYYTDTGPVLERDLAQRAGLGWIGKNSMLINPQQGSYFFLAEILLGIDLEPDPVFTTDHCGTCTLCIQACPTQCILSDRTLDARHCVSYLTIELKEDIPAGLRPLMQDWIFGCDICQQVCPWNRFAQTASAGGNKVPLPVLTDELGLTPQAFNQHFKQSPIKRAKRRGYLRNVAVALGNTGDMKDIQSLEQVTQDDEPMVREHAQWAKARIISRKSHEA